MLGQRTEPGNQLPALPAAADPFPFGILPPRLFQHGGRREFDCRGRLLGKPTGHDRGARFGKLHPAGAAAAWASIGIDVPGHFIGHRQVRNVGRDYIRGVRHRVQDAQVGLRQQGYDRVAIDAAPGRGATSASRSPPMPQQSSATRPCGKREAL